MAIKSYNPYSPSRRFMTTSSFEEITTDKPYRPLLEKLNKHAGRNNTGKNATKTGFPQKLLPSNTIRTVMPASRCCIM